AVSLQHLCSEKGAREPLSHLTLQRRAPVSRGERRSSLHTPRNCGCHARDPSKEPGCAEKRCPEQLPAPDSGAWSPAAAGDVPPASCTHDEELTCRANRLIVKNFLSASGTRARAR